MALITRSSSSLLVSSPKAPNNFSYVRSEGWRARVKNESCLSLRVCAGLSAGRVGVEM
jgi:hypothetical protein